MKCVLCGKEIKQGGHNVSPILDEGVCCLKCNERVICLRYLLVLGKPLLISTNKITEFKPKGEKFTLKELQEGVGGLIEIIPKFNDTYYIIVNEEGVLLNLPVNIAGLYLFNTEYFGNILLIPKDLLE